MEGCSGEEGSAVRDRGLTLQVDSASYRDPAGFVFLLGDEIYRAVDADHWRVLAQIQESGLLPELIHTGMVVNSRLVPSDSDEHVALQRACPGWAHFLWHERLPVLSYPYEWSFSMMADAALLTLALQEKLLRAGFSLKDASAFNIQFSGSQPVFIDLPSIEKPERRDIWMAYSQFCRMFLYPLLLSRHRGISFKSIFLANLEGPDMDQTFAALGVWKCLRPGLVLDLLMPRLFSRVPPRKVRKMESSALKSAADPSPQFVNLERLTRKIATLRASRRSSSHWSGYGLMTHYSDQARTEKDTFVRRLLKEHLPKSVLDLGCNTGTYSVMAAEQGARVVAVDGDSECVDRLYAEVRSKSLPILPLVVDLANPSPPLGFRNLERKSFMERAPADAVLALALVHHLLVTARMPLEAICDLLADLTRRILVVEFVEREDDMFQSLLALREDLYRDLSVDRFASVFQRRFDLIERQSLTGCRRHLFALQKKP